MLYDPSTNSALHAWLVKTLEPICDAEPEALATYIVALLKHEGPENELRKEVTKQLNEFFENGAASFVDALFATLRSKSYIPYTTTTNTYPSSNKGPADSGIPIPLDALLTPSGSSASDRGTKRPLDNNEADSRGPPKGPRLSDETERRISGGSYDRRRDDMNIRGGQTDGHSSQNFQMSNGRPYLPKGVCRDYHLKGFCSRGALCKFSHDDIGLPLPMNMAMNGVMPFMGMYGAMPFGMLPGQPSTYDPTDARLDMSAYTGGPSMPSGRNGPANGMMGDGHMERTVVQELSRGDNQGMNNVQSEISMTSIPNMPIINSVPHIPPPDENSMRGGGSSTRGRGRGGHGTFGGGHQTFNEELENGRSTKTIVVEKIPDEHISLEAVNSWFKRFGTVTNVAVDVKGKKALVSFSTREEARKAWAAEEAVFNNRFVKIFWHRPMEGKGVAGTRALQASASFVANIGADDKDNSVPNTQTPEKMSTPSIAKDSPKPNVPSKNVSVLLSKEEQLVKHIAEQKDLMGKLGTSTGEEKKQIMSRLRALAAEMKSASSTGKVAEGQSRQSSHAPEDKEQKERDRLDAELDMHAKGSDEETTEQLKEKLAKLQAEASALGITDVMSPAPTSYRGGFRGRGRGRAIHRGAMRGGHPRGSMKLDNRTKSLLVKGVASRDETVTQAVQSWFAASGQLASLEAHEDDSLIATFQTRAAAELAMGKGADIPSVGAIKLSWYNVPPVKPPPSQSLVEKKDIVEHPSSPRPEADSEETGWGNEDDMGRF